VYFRAILFGVSLSLATLALVVIAAMLGVSFLLPALIYFGAPLAYLLNLIIPDQLIYQLVPEGGGPAFIGISLVGALLQLIAVYSLAIYRFRYRARA